MYSYLQHVDRVKASQAHEWNEMNEQSKSDVNAGMMGKIERKEVTVDAQIYQCKAPLSHVVPFPVRKGGMLPIA